MLKDKHVYNILVIEDNPGDFVLVEEFLLEKIAVPKIAQATNFSQASACLKDPANTYDVILLDLTLPDKSGQNLLDEILNLAGARPVIILTGNVNIEFSIKSISQGISDYLIKDELNGISLYKSIIYCIERVKQIQEIKESEQKYSDLFHLNPQPMWVYDLETLQFLDVNSAAINTFGFTRREFLSLSIKDIRLKQDFPELEKEIDRIREEVGYFTHGNYRHTKKDQEVIHVELHGNVINYKGRRAEIVIANDITEKFNYIRAIEEQNKQLSDIAWMQSHVVRAPLARMMGIIDLIKNYPTPENEKSLLINYLLNSAYELDTLIRDISDRIYDAKSNT